MSQIVIMVSKIRPKNLGNPKVAAGFSEQEIAEQKIHWLGVILGKASGIKKSVDAKDDTKISYGLVGFFEGQPADTAKPILKSGICWLPGGIHEMVVETVRGLKPGEFMPFSFRIGTKGDTNAAGYSYVVDNNTVATADAQDPLADLRGDAVKQLAAPASKETVDAKPARARARAR